MWTPQEHLGERKKEYPITLLYCLKISEYLCAVFLLLASCREVCEIMQNSEYLSSYQPLSKIKKIIHGEVFKKCIAVRKNSNGLVTESTACKNCRPCCPERESSKINLRNFKSRERLECSYDRSSTTFSDFRENKIVFISYLNNTEKNFQRNKYYLGTQFPQKCFLIQLLPYLVVYNTGK